MLVNIFLNDFCFKNNIFLLVLKNLFLTLKSQIDLKIKNNNLK